MAGDFLSICRNEKKSVSECLSKAYADKVETNRKALLAIIDVLVSLAKRGIPLRGNWCKDQHEEDSNFMFFVKWKGEDNEALGSHLKNAPCNARYLSPKTQNELIDSFASILRSNIVAEAMKSQFFSIMADETCDISKIEQLSLCIRYLKDNNGSLEVAEDFLGFVQLPETNAAAITEAMLGALKDWNIDLQKWRGKGFDGAAIMSGRQSGVSTRIQQTLPYAKYFTHCRSHCLNLVIVNSCQNVPEVRNFMSFFKELTLFVNYSTKRKHIITTNMSEKIVDDLTKDLEAEKHEEEHFQSANRRQVLPTLSDTRWLSRVDSISTILVKNEQIKLYLSMEIIAEKSSDQSKQTTSFVKKMGEFSFIVTAVMTQYVLAFIRPLSVSLQSKTCDLVQGYAECQSLVELIKRERCEDTFRKLFNRATKILESTFGEDEEPTCPRFSARKRQMHLANAPAASPEEFYRLNYFYAFLDHVLSHLETRFPKEHKNAMLAYYLLPDHLSQLTKQIEECILDEYKLDLPLPDTFEAEVGSTFYDIV